MGWPGFGSGVWSDGGRGCRTPGHQLDHPGGEVAAVPEGVSQALPRHGPQESRLAWLVSKYKTLRDYSVSHLVQFFSIESLIIFGNILCLCAYVCVFVAVCVHDGLMMVRAFTKLPTTNFVNWGRGGSRRENTE